MQQIQSVEKESALSDGWIKQVVNTLNMYGVHWLTACYPPRGKRPCEGTLYQPRWYSFILLPGNAWVIWDDTRGPWMYLNYKLTKLQGTCTLHSFPSMPSWPACNSRRIQVSRALGYAQQDVPYLAHAYTHHTKKTRRHQTPFPDPTSLMDWAPNINIPKTQ